MATVKEIAQTFGDLEAVYLGEPIPADTYYLEVMEATTRRAKKDDFPYVELRMRVIDGEYEGRKVVERLFLRTRKDDGKPSQALHMTKGILSVMFDGVLPTDITGSDPQDADTIARAIVDNVGGKQFECRVVIEKGDDDGVYGDKNRLQVRKPRG